MGNNSGKFEFNFKKENTLEERKKKYNEFKELFPDKIPIIVEKDKSCRLKDIGISKLVVEREDTIGQLIYRIRKKLNIDPARAIILRYAKNGYMSGEISIGEAYEKYKGSDGFLYLLYSEELCY